MVCVVELNDGNKCLIDTDDNQVAESVVKQKLLKQGDSRTIKSVKLMQNVIVSKSSRFYNSADLSSERKLVYIDD